MSKQPISQTRILAGQCPLCGKEAAPYRLCYDHRQAARLGRCLAKGVRVGSLLKTWDNRYSINKTSPADAQKKWSRNSTKVILPETDRRARPRLRGTSVDVEETMLKIIERIGRPCTIEEISEAWGRLRDRRSSPLPSDLATIISAKDKRERKMKKLAAMRHSTSLTARE